MISVEIENFVAQSGIFKVILDPNGLNGFGVLAREAQSN